jgi:hypothetical protein
MNSTSRLVLFKVDVIQSRRSGWCILPLKRSALIPNRAGRKCRYVGIRYYSASDHAEGSGVLKLHKWHNRVRLKHYCGLHAPNSHCFFQNAECLRASWVGPTKRRGYASKSLWSFQPHSFHPRNYTRFPGSVHDPSQCTLIHTKNLPKTTFSIFYISTATSLFALKFKN